MAQTLQTSDALCEEVNEASVTKTKMKYVLESSIVLKTLDCFLNPPLTNVTEAETGCQL